MTGIVTVTLAPAIDLTYRVDRVEPGAVNRASSWDRELSGKGVNVSHAAALAGAATAAVLPLADDDLAADDPSWLRPVASRSRTRVNTTLATDDGVTTKVNAPASPLTDAEVRALRDAAVFEARSLRADWVVVAGSVPPLAPGGAVDLGAFVDDLAEQDGFRVAVDTSGAALEALFASHLTSVSLVKPNTLELATATGRALRTLGDVAEAARSLVDRGCETVYVSMGEDGALGVTADGTWWARATAPSVVNATGAGDASLAGFLVHAGAGAPDVPTAITGAAAFGALSVSQPSTLLHDLATAPPAELIRDPDPATPLRDPAR